MMTDKDQGIVRDNNRGEEQPADKERAQNVASVEEKAKNERREKKALRGNGNDRRQSCRR